MSGRLEGHSHKLRSPGSNGGRKTTQWQLFREYSMEDARTIIEKSKQKGGQVLHQAGQAHFGRTVERVLDRSPRWQTETDRDAAGDGRANVLDARGMGRRAVGPGVGGRVGVRWR